MVVRIWQFCFFSQVLIVLVIVLIELVFIVLEMLIKRLRLIKGGLICIWIFLVLVFCFCIDGWVLLVIVRIGFWWFSSQFLVVLKFIMLYKMICFISVWGFVVVIKLLFLVICWLLLLVVVIIDGFLVIIGRMQFWLLIINLIKRFLGRWQLVRQFFIS